jgi:hypothetical protein
MKMKCTHNCDSCKCKIDDVNGFPCCVYFGAIPDDVYWVKTFLSGHALEYFNGSKLYFYADGLYLYDPITCIKQQVNYKMRKVEADVSGVVKKKYVFVFEKVRVDSLKDWSVDDNC